MLRIRSQGPRSGKLVCVASLLAWVDYSSAHRDDMDRLLDAFRDKGTVDELGIGTIRDTFSDALFPGTSTLHTRARYLLFVPWAITATTAHRYPADRAAKELRRLEERLIGALRKSDHSDGVIGRDAGSSLRRMPSVLYWTAMRRYGLKRCEHSVDQHLRFASQQSARVRDEDDDSHHLAVLDPCFRQLPAPPAEWLTVANFELTREEAEFLREQIISTCGGHYLAWLMEHGVSGDPAMPWDDALLHDLPAAPARTLRQAKLFSILHEGAPILYNLLLARQKDWAEGIEEYESRLAAWQDSHATQAAANEWDNLEFWGLLFRLGWRARSSTQSFIEGWVSLVQAGQPLDTSRPAAELVQRRERQLKGLRSRFVNREALDVWQGGSGMGQLTYRWVEAKRLIHDIHTGLQAPIA